MTTSQQDIKLHFGPVTLDHLDRIHALESAGYPEDEAASYQNLKYRIQNANGTIANGYCAHCLRSHLLTCNFVIIDLFLGAYTDASETPASLIGYTCSTRSIGSTLRHESMFKHEPSGESVCIHSVCVDGNLRRKGIATKMLKEYIVRLVANNQSVAADNKKPTEWVLLLCKENLISLYSGAGFTLVGPSSVVHGQEQWFEMRIKL